MSGASLTVARVLTLALALALILTLILNLATVQALDPTLLFILYSLFFFNYHSYYIKVFNVETKIPHFCKNNEFRKISSLKM